MEDYVRKLALWDTKTFKPIMTHDELEPIMAKLGFVSLPPFTTTTTTTTTSSPSSPSFAAAANTTTTTTTTWKEYIYTEGRSRNPWPTEPRPRLPYPRIDGLHHLTYRAFCDAVATFIGKRDIGDHFHVRGMALHRIHDKPFGKKFRSMSEEEGLYVYREGTLDQTITNISNSNKNNNNNGGSPICSQLVPLKDVITLVS